MALRHVLQQQEFNRQNSQVAEEDNAQNEFITGSKCLPPVKVADVSGG